MSQKGRKNAYLGKKVDRQQFYDLLEQFCSGGITLTAATKIIGLSRPTLSKRWNMALLGEKLPEAWFLDGKEE